MAQRGGVDRGMPKPQDWGQGSKKGDKQHSVASTANGGYCNSLTCVSV